MNVSGKTISSAPSAAACSIRAQVFSTPASRSRNGDAACTAAALTFGNRSPIVTFSLCVQFAPVAGIRECPLLARLREEGNSGGPGKAAQPGFFKKIKRSEERRVGKECKYRRSPNQ